MTLAIVCGLEQEAEIISATFNWQPGAPGIIVGAGDAKTLSAKLEAAIAAGAKRVLSLGICGALNPSLRVGDVVVGTSSIYGLSQIAADTSWSDRLFDALAPKGLSVRVSKEWIAWSQTAVARLVDKAALRKATGGDIVDEETFIAGSIAAAHGLPWSAVRVVCDPASFELPPAALTKLTAAGADDLGAILASVAGDIWQLPELVQLAGLSATAFRSLRAALARTGPDFGA